MTNPARKLFLINFLELVSVSLCRPDEQQLSKEVSVLDWYYISEDTLADESGERSRVEDRKLYAHVPICMFIADESGYNIRLVYKIVIIG